MNEMKLGSVGVVTEDNRGHSVEFHADRIVSRLISVSDTAPDPIKAQALEYKESLKLIVLDGIKRAVASDRTTLAGHFDRHGLRDAASYIRSTIK